MNIKRWFAWACFVLMLVAEGFLFRANHGRDAALADLQAAQHELQQARSERDELKNSNAGSQAAENQRLHKQNEILTAKLAALQTTLNQLKSESQATAQHLTTARTALQLQQEHLQQLQTEKQQASSTLDQQNACINNLRIIDAAKQQWALEKNQTATAVPTAEDLLPYLKDGVFPSCAAGGLYSINAVGEVPTCSIAGHALTQ
jgi:chromosome segregation ATPase